MRIRKELAGQICILALMTTAIFAPLALGYARALPAAPKLTPNAVDAGDVWVAPSVVGLDWTKPEWTANLPAYEVAAAPQLNTLMPKAAKVELLPTPAFVGNAPKPVAANTGEPIAAPTDGSPGALVVTGKFVTPLSNDLYTGADTAMNGIVWGLVEIRRCTDGALLANGMTKEKGANAGKFSITIENPGTAGFQVWIIPDTSAGSVRTGTGGYNSYGTYTSCFTTGGTSYNIGTYNIYSGSGGVYRGAWMIYETIVNDNRGWGVWNYFANKLGTNGMIMPYLIVRFPFETWAHYHPGGEIHLPTMNDARSPDVIQHEYGHFAMYTVYAGSFTTYCPSPHYINGISHVNCAWSEGWASYVPYMTHNDKTYTYANNFEVDEETPTWATSGWDNGPAVEGRVTAALIDLSDSQNEGWDLAGGYTSQLWWVFRNKGMNVNFHDFMADFRSKYASSYKTPTVLTLWCNTIYYVDL